MRRISIMAALLITCLFLTSCGRKGIIHLSVADSQLCQQILIQEDELFSKAVAALGGVESQSPENRGELLSVYKECREYLDRSDQFVKQMYEKYGVSEADYRLDVFGGAFMPLSK
ncbi:MAG TPA: hypothetical protein VNH22_18515 [Blastocatellia bacterium]|nr:hypothetical protein [Blastocatellia bacterium]